MEKEEKLYKATELLESLDLGELAGLQHLLNQSFSSRMKSGEAFEFFADLDQEKIDDVMKVQSNSELAPIAQLISNITPPEKLQGLKDGIQTVRGSNKRK